MSPEIGIVQIGSPQIGVVEIGIGQIAVVQVGVQGPPGPSGGAAIAGEETSSGLTGTTIPIAGFSSPADYQVIVAYAEDPGSNGVLWVEKATEEFTVKHYGPNTVKFSYIASATGG